MQIEYQQIAKHRIGRWQRNNRVVRRQHNIGGGFGQRQPTREISNIGISEIALRPLGLLLEDQRGGTGDRCKFGSGQFKRRCRAQHDSISGIAP